MNHQATTRRFWSSTVAPALALALLAVLVPTEAASATHSNLSSDQVAAEIVRVQAMADDTAQRWAQERLRSEELAVQLSTAESRLGEANARSSTLQRDLSEIAIDRFTSASSQSMLILFDDPTEEMQTNALRNLVLDVGATDLDHIDSVQSDLADARSQVQALQDQNARLSQDLAAREAELEVQLADLATLREHLEDEEVARAYEQQLARRRQEQADQQAKAAAAAAAAAAPATPRKGGGAQPAPTASEPEPEPEPEPAPAPAPSPNASQSSPPTTSAPAPQPEPEREPEPATAQPPAAVSSGSGWTCPVAGPNAFGDTWGAPRPGGRSHQGVDMMSPGGTPLVAVVAGSVTMKTNALGGNVVWLTGVDGAKYYYAHLSAWAGSSRSVSGGEVIGYVGRTGNTTANHLHFQIHPGGGAAVNPTPTVRRYC